MRLTFEIEDYVCECGATGNPNIRSIEKPLAMISNKKEEGVRCLEDPFSSWSTLSTPPRGWMTFVDKVLCPECLDIMKKALDNLKTPPTDKKP